MKKIRIWKLLCCFLLMLTIAVTATAPAAGQSIAEKESNAPCVAAFAMRKKSVATPLPLTPHNSHSTTIPREALEGLLLYPGGMPFGVKFLTEGVTVVGICDVEGKNGTVNPATEAGLRQKDMILAVNGAPLAGAAQLTELIEGCDGQALQLHCKRGKNEFDVTLTPAWCPAESRYKTGIWVRDSGAGIGTVTFILPDTGAFGGLGHGICDSESGELIMMKRGSVSDVTISSVIRGEAGAPGELKGYFNAGKVGALLGNSNCGVWGVFSEVPETALEPMPVALREELEEGDAYILSTLDSNKIERYDVKISNINRDAAGPKCFTVTVTDPDLIAVSGGIVQGMSGSPIIQNGKLVGAVTHVLINDPTTGYGIFIENMLTSVQIPMARVS
ncbi:MAG: SpoIVB peptidase [Clostridia bacterium]|nr:SpoIVB peptidase [Clostridia bacterium]